MKKFLNICEHNNRTFKWDGESTIIFLMKLNNYRQGPKGGSVGMIEMEI